MSQPDPVESAVLDALRPALDAALDHARTAVADGDPASVPSPVRRLLQLARVTPQTLRVVRSSLEADAAFRAAVSRSPEGADLDGLAADWLARAPGWDAAVEAVVTTARHDAVLAEEASARRDAQRRLSRVEERRRRAEDELERSVAEVERLRDRLHASAAEVDGLRSEVAALTVERDEMATRHAAAADRAQRAEASLGEERGRRRELAAEVDRLAVEMARARTPPPVGVAPGARDQPADPPADPPLDVDELRRAVARAAELVGLIDPDRAGAASRRSDAPRRRRPVRVGRGLVEGSPEGVLALLAVDDMVVLVDGYNVTKAAWPDLGLDLQRERLVAVLADVCARTAGCCDVVFDGADVAPGRGRIGTDVVGVSFSAPDVEADDEILRRVARLPADRPVTVVSSDNRVRDGAADLGANVLSAAELIGVFR